MTDNKSEPEIEERSKDSEPTSQAEKAPRGPIEKFIQKFFGRNKPEPKKPDPNIYPLY